VTTPGLDPVDLVPGAVGPAVADVQHRLQAIGIPTGLDPQGFYGDGTRAAVETFQYRRGLRVDGRCGPQTWSTLVEAGRRLGDRFLYRHRPMFRGDDVAELQQRLSALGFDTGRVDGIFGDTTSRALGEFQRNVGLPVDGIAGPATLQELLRLSSRHEQPELVTAVRDRERLRQSPRTLAGRRVAIGEEGGLDALVTALRRILVQRGARVTTHHHPDGSVQAQEANAAGAEVYLGLRLEAKAPRFSTAYYEGYRYASPGGKLLAELLHQDLPTELGILRGECRGMSLPILRETRMPAVICELGPAAVVVEQSAILCRGILVALGRWVGSSWE
jgi:N-acetylmuramoyl-L-alanine amidase